MGFRLGKRSNGSEDGKAGSKTDGNAPGNASIGTRGVNSTGAMGTKSDPVC